MVVKYKAKQHRIRLPSSALVADLQTVVAEATGVQPALQRLLFKGALMPSESALVSAGLPCLTCRLFRSFCALSRQAGQLRPEATLAEAGLGNHAKVMLIGSDATELTLVQDAEARYRQALGTPPRHTTLRTCLGLLSGSCHWFCRYNWQPRA